MTTPISVLIVEDAPEDAELIIMELRRNGFEPFFERVETCESMLVALDKNCWDVVIADYIMPSFSGLAAIELLHKKKLDLPCIIISGKVGEEVAVEAMRAGAHDYLVKGQVDGLDRRVEIATEKFLVARSKHTTLLGQKKRASARVKKAEKRLDQLQTHLDTRANDMYRTGQLGFLDVLLGAKSYEQFARTWDVLKQLNESDAAYISQTKVARAEAKDAVINATIGTAFEEDGSPLALEGYQEPETRISTGVHDRLYARALALASVVVRNAGEDHTITLIGANNQPTKIILNG